MKKFCRLLTVLLVCCVLVGCGSVDSDLPELPSSLKQEIEAARNDLNDKFKFERLPEFVWYDESDASTWAEGVRYYGTYGNAVALYLGGSGVYPVGEMGIDNGIIFYANGEIYFISSAIKEGVVTTEDIQNVASFHKAFSLTMEKRGSVFVYEGCEGVTVLPAELQKEVEAAWWEKENYELNWTRKQDGIRYYGNYDGTVVVYTNLSITDDWYEIEIGGVKIGGGNFKLYAYREGEIVYANEAYRRGWLTKENLQTIAEYHELCRSKYKQ